MTDLSKQPDPAVRIGPLAEELRDAQERLAELAREKAAASIATTDQINRVNQAQKAFDVAVAALRNSAPSQTDWQLQKHKSRSVAVDAGYSPGVR